MGRKIIIKTTNGYREFGKLYTDSDTELYDIDFNGSSVVVSRTKRSYAGDVFCSNPGFLRDLETGLFPRKKIGEESSSKSIPADQVLGYNVIDRTYAGWGGHNVSRQTYLREEYIDQMGIRRLRFSFAGHAEMDERTFRYTSENEGLR